MRLTTTFVLLAAAILPAAAQSPDSPPLRPNEYVAKTKSGCRLVHTLPPGDTIAHKTRWVAYYATADFTGPCEHGLATGKWTIVANNSPTEFNYAYGRQLSRRVVERFGGHHHKAVVYRADTIVSVPAWSDPWVAKWTPEIGGESWLDGPSRTVITFSATCADFRASFPDCTQPYDVYGVRFGARASVRSNPTGALQLVNDSVSWCPNPRTPVGCEKLWEQISAPVRSDIQRFVLKAAELDSARVRSLVSYNAQWIASAASKAPLEPPIVTVAMSPPAAASTSPPAPPAAATQSSSAPAPAPPAASVFTGPTTFTPTFSDPVTRVTALELPGIPSRGGCLALSWLSQWRAGIRELTPVLVGSSKDFRALIATNTCSEDIWMTSIACTEDRLTEPSNAAFHKATQYQPVAPWQAGAVRGFYYFYNSIVGQTRMPPGTTVMLAYVLTRPRVPNRVTTFESRHVIAELLYGAWPLPLIYSTSESKGTEAGMLDSRRRMAVMTAYGQRTHGYNGATYNAKSADYPSQLVQYGGRDCAAANMPAAWRSTN